MDEETEEMEAVDSSEWESVREPVEVESSCLFAFGLLLVLVVESSFLLKFKLVNSFVSFIFFC